MAKKDETTPVAEKVKRAEKNGVSRPNPGSKTGRIWEISDHLSAKTNQPAKRADVLAAAEKEEINKSTAMTQYGQWRKFHGLAKEVVTPTPSESKAAPEPEAEMTEAEALLAEQDFAE